MQGMLGDLGHEAPVARHRLCAYSLTSSRVTASHHITERSGLQVHVPLCHGPPNVMCDRIVVPCHDARDLRTSPKPRSHVIGVLQTERPEEPNQSNVIYLFVSAGLQQRIEK